MLQASDIIHYECIYNDLIRRAGLDVASDHYSSSLAKSESIRGLSNEFWHDLTTEKPTLRDILWYILVPSIRYEPYPSYRQPWKSWRQKSTGYLLGHTKWGSSDGSWEGIHSNRMQNCSINFLQHESWSRGYDQSSVGAAGTSWRTGDFHHSVWHSSADQRPYLPVPSSFEAQLVPSGCCSPRGA